MAYTRKQINIFKFKHANPRNENKQTGWFFPGFDFSFKNVWQLFGVFDFTITHRHIFVANAHSVLVLTKRMNKQTNIRAQFRSLDWCMLRQCDTNDVWEWWKISNHQHFGMSSMSEWANHPAIEVNLVGQLFRRSITVHIFVFGYLRTSIKICSIFHSLAIKMTNFCWISYLEGAHLGWISTFAND